MKAHFVTFAAYNAWANRRLYEAASALSDETRKADVGAFFGSLHATLAHLVMADRIWLSRMQGTTPTPPDPKDPTLTDFELMRPARVELDGRFTEFVAGLNQRDLERSATHSFVSFPEKITLPLSASLAHVFNHQTHHRGQCHHMLSAAGQDAPPLDLLYYERELAGFVD